MSEKNLKVAIVTGGSRGIGHAIALRLATDGFAVVINYASNKVKAEETVAAITAAGGKSMGIQGDISQPEDVEHLFKMTKDTFGRIDVVINSAGIMPMATINASHLDALDKVIAINLRGAFLVLAQAAEHLTKGGRIIAFSTSVIAKSFPAYGPYVASKAGVEALVHVLANELRGKDITVNAIAPGPVNTELFLNGKTEEQIKQIAQLAPLGRIGEPDEIASVVSFLAGPDSGWINSQVIRVNGGFA